MNKGKRIGTMVAVSGTNKMSRGSLIKVETGSRSQATCGQVTILAPPLPFSVLQAGTRRAPGGNPMDLHELQLPGSREACAGPGWRAAPRGTNCQALFYKAQPCHLNELKVNPLMAWCLRQQKKSSLITQGTLPHQPILAQCFPCWKGRDVDLPKSPLQAGKWGQVTLTEPQFL